MGRSELFLVQLYLLDPPAFWGHGWVFNCGPKRPSVGVRQVQQLRQLRKLRVLSCSRGAAGGWQGWWAALLSKKVGRSRNTFAHSFACFKIWLPLFGDIFNTLKYSGISSLLNLVLWLSAVPALHGTGILIWLLDLNMCIRLLVHLKKWQENHGKSQWTHTRKHQFSSFCTIFAGELPLNPSHFWEFSALQTSV